jgi:hypothetical protein
METRATRGLASLFLGIVAAGCGGPPAAPPAAEAPPAPAAAGPAAAPAEDHAAAHAAEAASAALPPVPAGARVFFAAPSEGGKLEGPLENGKVTIDVRMGAEGIAIKPAGPVEAGSGHHHILIDTAPVPVGAVVPKDEQHVHFGQGQTEAKLALVPGEHTLSLQLADGIHRSYGPQVAATVKVTVVAAGTVAAQPKPPTTKP